MIATNTDAASAAAPGESASAKHRRVVRSIRFGLILVIVGLLMQVLAALFWTPGTFVLAASVGVPAVVLGAAIFGRAAWRAIDVGDVGAPEGDAP